MYDAFFKQKFNEKYFISFFFKASLRAWDFLSLSNKTCLSIYDNSPF